MQKLHVFMFLAVFANVALGIRQRRQADEPENQDDLEDRYGWNRPDFYPYPNPFPNPFPFPNPNNNNNNNRPPRPQPTTTTTTQAPNNGATTLSPDVQNCIRTCPTTAEYNPVCGSNGNTYDNPGRLSCAQLCGVPVTLLRASRCPPATTAAPTS